MINSYLKKIRLFLINELNNDNVSIFIFGSRARKDSNIHSDIDIGIIPKHGFKKEKLALLKEKIENLNIPYKVDLVDFSNVSEEFKQNTLKEAKIWKK